MSEPPDDAERPPTELVMQKDGEYVEIWAIVDGKQVFHAKPPAKFSWRVIGAAVRTWVRRAYPDVLDNGSEPPQGGFA